MGPVVEAPLPRFAGLRVVGGFFSSVPRVHVGGVCVQVGAGGEEAVVEVEVQVVGLDVVEDEHRRHRGGEFPEGVEDVLGL